NSKKDIGGPLDELWQGGREIFLSQTSWLQWAEIIGGLIGGGIVGKKGLREFKKVGERFFKKGDTPKVDPKDGTKPGVDTKSDGKGKMPKWLKGLGKWAGPIGFLSTLDVLIDPVNEFGDWFFGHDPGTPKPKPILNPFAEQEYHDDYRRGFLRSAWDFLTPWDTKYEKEQKAKKAQEQEEAV